MSGIEGDIQSAPQTFSSWDQCMTKVYCKWPAIIGIVIGSLIVLSIVWCFARCICCGVSCCCECFRCCGCLESCTRSRGSKDSRSRDQYAPVQNQQPMPYQGYQAPPMMYGAAPPQFATFEASKKVNEDSLPAMPSWDTAQTRRVEDPNQDMEMKDLEHQATGGQRLSRNRNEYAPVPNSTAAPIHSPYSDQQDAYMRGGTQPHGSDLGAQRQNQDPYSRDDRSYDRPPMSPAPTYNSGPAPTYHTTQQQSPRPAMNNNQSFNSDRYASPPSQQQQWSPVESTRYEPTEYPASTYRNVAASPTGQRPPSFQSFGPPNGQPRQSYQPPAGEARPPSFLQIGRKPLNGSIREL